MTKLQDRYRTAFSNELDHLHSALQGSQPRATHESLHKLQGLAYLRKDPVVIDLLKSISPAVTTDEPSAPLIGFCDQLKHYIEQTHSDTLTADSDCQR